jgi:transposase
MSKAPNNFIGIDISKQTIDVALIANGRKEQILHSQFKKNSIGLKALARWLRSVNVFLNEGTVCCMEHTGLYNRSLLSFLQQHTCIIWVEMAHHIQLSLGLQRGKSDKVDAERIALFAYKNREEIKQWQPLDADIQHLKDLLAQRERLLQAKVMLTVPVKELEKEGCKKEAKLLIQLEKTAIDGISKSLANVEVAIKKLIAANAVLQRKVTCMTSVTGIGEVIAWHFIVHTNGFKRLNTGKQLACYCGVAPFKHESGTSIKGRNRVSHMANKKLKCLLHMGAMAAITYDEGLRTYYKRKVAEGKNKMSILNAVRNKLILRIAAVIRDDKEYVKVKIAA